MGLWFEKTVSVEIIDQIQEMQRLIAEYDFATYSHCQKVAHWSVLISTIMGIDSRDSLCLYHGALIHDVGKLTIPRKILNKPGKLTSEEWLLIKDHPSQGERLVKTFFSEEWDCIRNICLYHHERFDGKGYPHGLAGKKIPLEARIVTVADAIDAMLTYRPYRKGTKSWPEALAELCCHAGTQFDPDIVDRLVRHSALYLMGFWEDGGDEFTSEFLSEPNGTENSCAKR